MQNARFAGPYVRC